MDIRNVGGIATLPNGLFVSHDDHVAAINGRAGSRLSLAGILRFKWMILGVWLLVAVPLVMAIWMFTKPEHRVKAELHLRPIIPVMVYKTYESGEIPYYQSYVNTQVAMIFSPKVLGRALATPEVRNTAWYLNPPKMPWQKPSSPMERMLEGLSALPRPMTEIVDLSFVAEKPADAALILNVIMDQYVKSVDELADQSNDALYRKLSEEREVLRNEIDEQENALAKLQKDIGTSTPDELISRRKVRLDEEAAAIGKLRLEIASLQWQQHELEELAQQNPSASQPNKLYSSDVEWRRLYIDTKTSQMQLNNERRRFQEDSPLVAQAKERLTLAREMLRAREKQMDDMTHLYPSTAPGAEVTISAELEALGRKLKQTQYEEKLRSESLIEQQNNFKRTFDGAEAFAKEKEQIKHRKEIYEAIRTRLEQKQMERNVPGTINVLTRADASLSTSKDRRLAMSFLSVFLGLGLATGIAALSSKARRPVYLKEDLPRALQLPFLGSLPLVKRPPVEDDSELEEGIRIIRTALLARLNQGRERAFLITSANEGAGKSTLAFMLAKSLASCGKKVLLVDADIRNPVLTGRLGPVRNTGLAGAMRGMTSDENVICLTSIPNLSFVQTGAWPTKMGLEWNTDGLFGVSLNRWRENYDVVLLDSSPVLPVADASILCQTTDGVIMVVREGTGQRELADSIDRLSAAGGNIIGTVFIESRYHRGYGYGYSHYGAQA